MMSFICCFIGRRMTCEPEPEQRAVMPAKIKSRKLQVLSRHLRRTLLYETEPCCWKRVIAQAVNGTGGD